MCFLLFKSLLFFSHCIFFLSIDAGGHDDTTVATEDPKPKATEDPKPKVSAGEAAYDDDETVMPSDHEHDDIMVATMEDPNKPDDTLAMEDPKQLSAAAKQRPVPSPGSIDLSKGTCDAMGRACGLEILECARHKCVACKKGVHAIEPCGFEEPNGGIICALCRTKASAGEAASDDETVLEVPTPDDTRMIVEGASDINTDKPPVAKGASVVSVALDPAKQAPVLAEKSNTSEAPEVSSTVPPASSTVPPASTEAKIADQDQAPANSKQVASVTATGSTKHPAPTGANIFEDLPPGHAASLKKPPPMSQIQRDCVLNEVAKRRKDLEARLDRQDKEFSDLALDNESKLPPAKNCPTTKKVAKEFDDSKLPAKRGGDPPCDPPSASELAATAEATAEKGSQEDNDSEDFSQHDDDSVDYGMVLSQTLARRPSHRARKSAAGGRATSTKRAAGGVRATSTKKRKAIVDTDCPEKLSKEQLIELLKNNGGLPKKKKKRAAGSPPNTVKQQMDDRVREKLQGCFKQMKTTQAMSIPIVRRDDYEAPSDSEDEDNKRYDERMWPDVCFGIFCYTNQQTNEDGGAGKKGFFMRKPKLILNVGCEFYKNKIGAIDLSKVEKDLTVDMDDFFDKFRSKSARSKPAPPRKKKKKAEESDDDSLLLEDDDDGDGDYDDDEPTGQQSCLV